MIKYYKIMFFITLLTGTLIAISSYSWMSMWIGLEINLLSIIPLLSDPQNIYPSESALKYFITQALASVIFLFSIIMSLNLTEIFPQNSVFMIMMNSALLTKMGAAPFHAWFPEVMEGLNWFNCLIMLTWQKIAPMILLMYNMKMTMFLFCIIIFSSTLGSILGLNQISLRKILAYSSINHISWMIASMLNYQVTWLIYFLTYSIINLNIILILKYQNIYYLKQFNNTLNLNKIFKFFLILNFLSLGGLPPFLGFLPKWLTINNLISNNFFLLSILLIIFTLITLFFYLRLTFSTMIINTNENLIMSNKKINFLIIFLNFLTLSGLLTCTMIFNLN
uniref:NADH-ubiquinone oxidoreductase chain 2 n=1 Tax=Anastrangalia sequensi TaxID=763898 RepID=A0A343ERE8_9CUCU|nr:NADH dehydrogenase subunit 2 [Anastrangalia sequensi]ASL05654.1 NADH dehydrogenase subunit 2 [Anastrangalia sequensi]